MFFNKDKEEPRIEPSQDQHSRDLQQAPADVQSKANPELVEKFYYVDNKYEVLVLNVSNNLLKNHAVITFSDGVSFTAAHVGEALTYFNTSVQEVCQGGISMNKANWLKGEVPAGINPKIEIGADKIINYATETLEKYPTQEFDQYLTQFREFKNQYEAQGIQNAMGIASTDFTRS